MPGDALGDDRVALVRHRRRALLALPERLLDLPHLGALEVADLGGEALQPGARRRDGGQQLGVAVARHHLGRGVLAREAEALEHRLLQLGAVGGVGADGAGERAHRRRLHRPLEAMQVAVRLEREARQLHAERGRLGVHPVRAADAERVLVLTRAPHQGVAEVARAGGEDEPGLRQLERQRGVQHVGGREPVVHPPPGIADRCGHHVDERGDVVVGHLLALLDGLDRERGAGRGSPRRPPRARPPPRRARR